MSVTTQTSFSHDEFLNPGSHKRLPPDRIKQIMEEGRKQDMSLFMNRGNKIEITGDAKAGKTWWGISSQKCVPDNPRVCYPLAWLMENGYITLPTPLFWIDTELRYMTMANDLVGLDYYCWPLRFVDLQRKFREDPKKMLDYFWEILLSIASTYQTGTILIDTHSYIHRMIRPYIQHEMKDAGVADANAGEFIRLMPQDYSLVNDIWSSVIGIQQKIPQHVIYVSREGDEWGMVNVGKEKPGLGKTGNRVAKHYKEMPYEVDIVLRYTIDQGKPPLFEKQRVMRLQEYAWAGIKPENKEWRVVYDERTKKVTSDADFTEIMNYSCFKSHKYVLQQKQQEIREYGRQRNARLGINVPIPNN